MNITSEQFAYWLQGRLEDRDLSQSPLSIEEQKLIQEHVSKVFTRLPYVAPSLKSLLAPVKPETLTC